MAGDLRYALITLLIQTMLTPNRWADRTPDYPSSGRKQKPPCMHKGSVIATSQMSPKCNRSHPSKTKSPMSGDFLRTRSEILPKSYNTPTFPGTLKTSQQGGLSVSQEGSPAIQANCILPALP